ERGRHPGPGLRGADGVATGEDRGDRLFVNRRRSLVAEGVDRPEEDRFEAELVKGMFRVGRLHRTSYGLIGLRVPIRNEPNPANCGNIQRMVADRGTRAWGVQLFLQRGRWHPPCPRTESASAFPCGRLAAPASGCPRSGSVGSTSAGRTARRRRPFVSSGRRLTKASTSSTTPGTTTLG